MAVVVIKLVPVPRTCNCAQVATPQEQTAETTSEPGKMVKFAATSTPTATEPATEETPKKSNWWKWALAGLAALGLFAATGSDKDKDKNKKKRR